MEEDDIEQAPPVTLGMADDHASHIALIIMSLYCDNERIWT